MKSKNVFLISISVIAQLILALLFHLGKIGNINNAILIASGISAIVILIANCIERWFKGIVIAIMVFVCLIGCGKFCVMSGYVGSYAYAQINNNISINKIVSSEEYHMVMSYDGYDYYVDNGYTYLYKIKKKAFASEVTANTIMIDRDAESVFANVMGEFYSINDGAKFTNINNDKVAISFANNAMDASVFIKLISPDNKVFYSYLTVDNPIQFVTDMNIAEKIYDVGNVHLVLTKYSKIIDGTDNSDELGYVSGSRYLITVGASMYFSQTSVLEFSEKLGYYDRVNYYIYKDYFSEIEKYENQMNSIDKESEEYKELSGYVTNLKNAIESYSVELCWEKIGTDKTIRLYRTYTPGQVSESVPDITVIEIYENGKYVYANTTLTIDDLK